MKPLTLLLVLSLVANAALVAFGVRSQSGPFANLFSSSKTSHGEKSSTTVAGVSSGASVSAVDGKTWSNLQTGDLKTLVERLRAAGFPPAVIRAIISAQIRERYAAQRVALLGKQDETPYWQRPVYAYDAKVMAAIRDTYRQQIKETKELLGPDADSGNDVDRAWQRRLYGDLPVDKLDQMQSIVSDYSDLRNGIYSKANGVLLPEDRQQLAILETEQRADLAAALTPEELENYELRSSTTANAIRSQLSIFKPTEQEFRALFNATRAAEDQYGVLTNSPTNPDLAEKIRTAVLADLQTQISPERYAELQQATDPKYQMANRLVARLDLPASTAVDVVSIQQDALQRLSTIRRDTSPSSDQRNSQLAALAQDVTGKLNTTLTPRGLEAYKLYGGGWLQNLNPPVKTSKP
jgi:hypothetical protein